MKEVLTRRRLIETGVVLAGTAGVVLAVRATVDVMEALLKPRYVLRGNPAPWVEEPQVWRPLTQWEVKK